MSSVKVTVRRMGKPMLEPSELDSRLEKVMGEVLAEGEKLAKLGYATTGYIGDKDYEVTSNIISPRKGEIVASGKTILFLEYGSGTMAITDEDGNYGEDSWSVNHARQYHNNGYWYFGGTKIYGQPPARAMYEASKRMKLEAKLRLREELK